MRLSSRALKCTLLLDPGELAALPDPTGARVILTVGVKDAMTVTIDVASKALRKAKTAIAAHGVDGVAVLIQGKLIAGNVISEAGLVAQPKAPKPVTA